MHSCGGTSGASTGSRFSPLASGNLEARRLSTGSSSKATTHSPHLRKESNTSPANASHLDDR